MYHCITCCICHSTPYSSTHSLTHSLTHSHTVFIEQQPQDLTAHGSVKALIQRLREQPYYSTQITHVHMVPGKVAHYATLHKPLHPVLSRAFGRDLQDVHVQSQSQAHTHTCTCTCTCTYSDLKLYSHQVLAIDALRDGKHVTISTPTASGKCFHCSHTRTRPHINIQTHICSYVHISIHTYLLTHSLTYVSLLTLSNTWHTSYFLFMCHCDR